MHGATDEPDRHASFARPTDHDHPEGRRFESPREKSEQVRHLHRACCSLRTPVPFDNSPVKSTPTSPSSPPRQSRSKACLAPKPQPRSLPKQSTSERSIESRATSAAHHERPHEAVRSSEVSGELLDRRRARRESLSSRCLEFWPLGYQGRHWS
jgi:hypothetical protein